MLELRRFRIYDYIEKVRPIVEDVKKHGDEALRKYTEMFDCVRPRSFKVKKKKIDEAYEAVEDELLDALEISKENIERFHLITSVEKEIKVKFEDCVMGKRYLPIEKVGAYIPGGKASYPSTALMIGVPAKIAGVKKLIACTPPSKDGLNPLTLVACDIAGFDEIYTIGGAQAIAAMAYGTETVPKVYKIVGPGNAYVTAAKLLVSVDVAIDMPAGPSEILIIADETTNPDFIVADIEAQLEHDALAIAALITNSEKLANYVKEKIKSENFAVWVVEKIEDAIRIANDFAPEHLAIFCKNAEKYLEKIENAGSVFLGEFSAVAMADYGSGTNHVLPTMGYAKFYSGLSVESFMKHITFQILRPETFKRIGKSLIKIAEAEGMKKHAESIKIRLQICQNS